MLDFRKFIRIDRFSYRDTNKAELDVEGFLNMSIL